MAWGGFSQLRYVESFCRAKVEKVPQGLKPQ